MRIFAFIMSFIVLGLSSVPCADMAFAADHSETVAKNIRTAPTDQQHDESDSCSPFCHCTCCAGFSANHSIATLTHIHFLQKNNFSSFLSQNILEISLPVWQPPQIIA